MQVSLRSNCFAHSYFLRLDYQFSFPTEVQLRQGFPRQKSLTNETDSDTKTTETRQRENETKLGEGRRQEQGKESQN